MKVAVKLYASLREAAGKGEILLEAAHLADAVDGIRKMTKGQEAQILLNGRNACSLPAGKKLKKGDLLEAFPPVGGG